MQREMSESGGLVMAKESYLGSSGEVAAVTPTTPTLRPGARYLKRVDSPCLLIVDDDEQILTSFGRYFRSKGFQVVAVSRPHLAVELLLKERIDVVICDVCMPEMTGVDILRELRCMDESLPVILMSGQSGQEAIREAERFRAARFFEKPVSLGELELAIAAALSGRRRET